MGYWTRAPTRARRASGHSMYYATTTALQANGGDAMPHHYCSLSAKAFKVRPFATTIVLFFLTSLPVPTSGALVSVEVPSCMMNPSKFAKKLTFYVVECPRNVTTARLWLGGDNFFQHHDDGDVVGAHTYDIAMSDFQTPTLHNIHSCPKGHAPPSEWCTKYTFDVFRKGGSKATLAFLGVGGKRVMTISPNFEPSVLAYETTVPLYQQFEISASSKEFKTRVGIQYVGSNSRASGLSKDVNGCNLGASKHMLWSMPGFSAVGEYNYEICAMAANGEDEQIYKLKILVSPVYSVYLSEIKVNQWQLTPSFDPLVQLYEIVIDDKTFEVPLQLVAKDNQATIKVRGDVQREYEDSNELHQGSLSTAVQMHDNSHLHMNQAPQWTATMTIRVISADGESSMSYIVKVRQNVSTFCEMGGMKVGKQKVKALNEATGQEIEELKPICDLTPAFQPNITNYECKFDWSVSTVAEMSFYLNHEHCPDCQLQVFDPLKERRKHLSLQFRSEPQFAWKTAKVWSRKFLYGEYHTLPVRVVSADRFTYKTYNIYFECTAPWWMQTRVTRTISNVASVIATSMSFFSLTNLMALAKQFQFMSLTTAIRGIPPLYEDFAGNAQIVNLDIGPYMPDFGLPSLEDIKHVEKHLMHLLQKQTGLQHAQLLLQYCIAKHQRNRLYANAILHRHPKQAKQLVHHLNSPEMRAKFQKDSSDDGKLNDTQPEDDRLSGFLSPRERRLLNDAGGDVGDEEEEEEDDNDNDNDKDMEDNEKKEAMQEHVWGWTDDRWHKMLRKATKANVTLHTYVELPCSNPTLKEVEKMLKLVHELQLIRAMIHSPTGSFLIVTALILSMGSLYILFYETRMRGVQKRLCVLEPGRMLIVILDYALIAFTSGAASLLWQESGEVTFFIWKPSRLSVQIFSFIMLVGYPFCFVIFIFLQMCRLEANKALMYNKIFEQFTDVRCREMIVKLQAKIPKWIPVLPMLMAQHCRACIPVLDQEGVSLDFATMEANRSLRAVDIQKRVEARALAKQAVEDQKMEMDKELQAEIAQLGGKAYANEFKAHRQEMLKKQQKQDVERKERARKNIAKHVANNHRLRAASNMDISKAVDITAPAWMPSDAIDQWLPQLGALADTWKSIKARNDEERLDPEEKFAMQQYIDSAIRAEKHYMKYNILTVFQEHGRLKPREPLKEEYAKQGLKWLPNAHDYCKETEDGRGHHLMLQEFTNGEEFIENSLGHRLVYPGNDRQRWLGWIAKGGYEGANLVWKEEPDEGWDKWTVENTKKNSTTVYADKWQRLHMEHFDRPWSSDDDEDKVIRICGCWSISKGDIPFYYNVRKAILKFWRNRVPRRVDAAEKVEMRKWMWNKLKTFETMKLQLGYLADQHPKFYTGRSLAEIADMPFNDVWVEIEKAKPNPEQCLEDEVHLHDHELLDWTLMKLEDTYAFHNEPWWGDCDQPLDDEYKVMFDHETFWRSTGDSELEQLRKENDLVPRNGYYANPLFDTRKDQVVGTKRYKILKPDGSTTNVDMTVLMGHVLPLMRYTSGFKLNVSKENLDMPTRMSYKVVLHEKGEGEQFNYAIDRLTTLVSICVLSAKMDGPLSAFVFLLMRLVSFVFQLIAAFNVHQKEQRQEAKGEVESKDTEEALVAHEVKYKRDSSARLQSFIAACGGVDVTVLRYQTITLLVLCAGQMNWLPEPLTGLGAILVCSWTMIIMNLFTFKNEINKLIKERYDEFQKFRRSLVHFRDYARDWLAGENPFNTQFYVLPDWRAQSAVKLVDKITFFVPDLGINFEGAPNIDRLVPEDEQRAMELSKKITYHVLQNRDPEDTRIKSIRDHWRFQGDITQSLNVALDVEQILLRKKIPEVMATLQCVNHPNSKISRPAFDSFLTLFKPNDWDEDASPDDKKSQVEAMLAEWDEQVLHWMKHTLGAVETDRTATFAIRDEIRTLLRKECTGSISRDVFKARIDTLFVSGSGSFLTKDLSGKLGYVSVIWDSEMITQNFPLNRVSRFAKFEQFTGNKKFQQYQGSEYSHIRFALELNDEILFELPVGVNQIRFGVWVQYDDYNEELVAFTLEMDVRKQIGLPSLPVTLYSKWQLQGLRGVQPFGGAELDENEKAEKKKQEEQAATANDLRSRLYRWLDAVKRIAFCRWYVPTEEEIEATRGKIVTRLWKCAGKEQEDDDELMRVLKDVCEGESSMNLKKIKRHKDRWLQLAQFFGLHITETALQAMKRHVEKMQIMYKVIADDRCTDALKESKLQEEPFRRKLMDPKEMEAAIEKTRNDITAFEQRCARDVRELGREPTPAARLKSRKIGNTEVWPSKNRGEEKHMKKIQNAEAGGAEEVDDALANELLDFCWSKKTEEQTAHKRILHYVIVSDHIKPSKNWRPDAITPHVGAILTNEYDDVPQVRLSYDMGKELTFDRELRPNDKDAPQVLNGRLVFKSRSPMFGADFGFLYWDGRSRWVISPFRGEPAPYGLDTARASKFFWVSDNAVTPDKITKFWMRWPQDGSSRWKESTDVKITSKAESKAVRRHILEDHDMEQALLEKEEDDTGVNIFEIFSETINEVLNLSSTSSHRKLDPEFKECLISLAGNHICISWKDDLMDRLAPFRTMLLNEFGTYRRAWLYITRQIHMQRSLGQRNLAAMLQKTKSSIECGQYFEEVVEGSSNCGTLSQNGTPTACTLPATGAGSPSRTGLQRDKTAMLQRGGKQEVMTESGELSDRRDKSPDKSTQAVKWDRALTTSWNAGVSEKITLKQADYKSLVDFLDNVENVEELAAHVMAAIDQDESASINAEELQALFDGEIMSDEEMRLAEKEIDEKENGLAEMEDSAKEQNLLGLKCKEQNQLRIKTLKSRALLSKFKKFVRAHPVYSEKENLWAELSDGLEITLDDWKVSLKKLMLMFVDKTGESIEEQQLQREKINPGYSAEEKAQHIFQLLDVQMSRGISLLELIPSSGETLEDVNKSLLKFSIPLSYLSEIKADKSKKFGAEQLMAVRLSCNPRFATSSEWSTLRLALNPDWKPVPNHESLTICMRPAFHDLWQLVIIESNMLKAQEWVRFYDGNYAEHDHLKGTHCRDGYGVQRWAGGQVYAGGWHQHIYHGEGSLYASHEDMKDGLPAIYTGQWRDGKRNGDGVLRFEQDMQEDREGQGRNAVTSFFAPRQHRGVTKIYKGQFVDDLFRGEGTLYMDRVVSQALPTNNAGKHVIHLPCLEPSQLMYFNGTFQSHWDEADAHVRNVDAQYAKYWPKPEFSLDLNNIRLADAALPGKDSDASVSTEIDELTQQRVERYEKYKKYFDIEAGVQIAGKQMPDLAMSYYRHHHHDLKHMSCGKARYADGSEYAGQFYDGYPNGQGLVLQYELGPDGKQTTHQATHIFKHGEEEGFKLSDHGMVLEVSDGGQADTNGVKVGDRVLHVEDAAYSPDVLKSLVEGRSNYTITFQVGKELASYGGEWEHGTRSGHGVYKTREGLKYDGQWKNNLRNGHGVQHVPLDQNAEYGYRKYDGQWVNDLKQGDGKLYFGEEDKFLYEGQFVANLREGRGKIFKGGRDKDDDGGVLLCNGWFENDQLITTSTARAWARLAEPDAQENKQDFLQRFRGKQANQTERFYYGQLSESGMREGEGTLYAAYSKNERLSTDEARRLQEHWNNFMKAIETGLPFGLEDNDDWKRWFFTVYKGQWEGNVPHGKGIQHFNRFSDAPGLYRGQFVAGKRHGKGDWETYNGWKYRAIKGEAGREAPNWENDLMHGIAIVEDERTVHENVIYTRGKCQMPFVNIGPPLTGFDKALIVGSLIKTARQGKHTFEDRLKGNKRAQEANPGLSIADKGAKDMQNIHKKDSNALIKYGEASDKAITGTLVRAHDPDWVDHDKEERVVLLRELTDLTLLEKDIFVSGGTGVNAAINGFYVKLVGAYGMNVYRLCKKEAPKSLKDKAAVMINKVRKKGEVESRDLVTERYLWQDNKKGIWVISEKPMSALRPGPGVAFVDDTARDPGSISKTWYVWHPASRSMKFLGEDEEEDETRETSHVVAANALRKKLLHTDVDDISTRSIIGFEVLGTSGQEGGPNPGLMLRQASEIYSRPVYEADNGGQILYWLKKDSSVEEGIKDGSIDMEDPAVLLDTAGAWVFGQKLGAPPGSEFCLAYVEDSALNPHQIQKTWQVRKNGGAGKEASFREEPNLILKMQEWTRKDDVLGIIDGIDDVREPLDRNNDTGAGLRVPTLLTNAAAGVTPFKTHE